MRAGICSKLCYTTEIPTYTPRQPVLKHCLENLVAQKFDHKVVSSPKLTHPPNCCSPGRREHTRTELLFQFNSKKPKGAGNVVSESEATRDPSCNVRHKTASTTVDQWSLCCGYQGKTVASPYHQQNLSPHKNHVY